MTMLRRTTAAAAPREIIYSQRAIPAASRLSAGFFRLILCPAKGKIGQGLFRPPGDDHPFNEIL